MSLNRLPAVILAALTMTLAFAEPLPTTLVMRDLMAMEFDGVVITCPAVEAGGVEMLACYRSDSSVAMHKLDVEQFIRKFDDVEWLRLWMEDGGVLARWFLYYAAEGPPQHYLFSITENRNSFGSFGWVSHEVEFDQMRTP